MNDPDYNPTNNPVVDNTESEKSDQESPIKLSRTIKKRAHWTSEDKKELAARCGKGLLKHGKINKETVDRE